MGVYKEGKNWKVVIIMNQKRKQKRDPDQREQKSGRRLLSNRAGCRNPLSVGSEQDDPVRCQGPMLALVC